MVPVVYHLTLRKKHILIEPALTNLITSLGMTPVKAVLSISGGVTISQGVDTVSFESTVPTV